MSARFSLVVLTGRQAGQVVELPEGAMVVGRDSDADFLVDCEAVSRHHAKLVVDADGTVTLHDLHSTGGQYVNGVRPPNPARIEVGDRLAFGSTTIVELVAGGRAEAQAQYGRPIGHDFATGVWVRSLLLSRLGDAFERARADGAPLGVVAFGVMGMRDHYDRHGHLRCEELLGRLCERVRSVPPATATFGRLTQSEFVVVLPGCTAQEASALAETMAEAAATVADDDARPLVVRFGVAQLSAQHDSPEALLAEALDPLG